MSTPSIANEQLCSQPSTDMGHVSELLQNCDWSHSPLGAPAAWSASLKTTVRMMLASHAQIVLFWGPDLAALYNDAYAPTIGEKHPGALGRPAVESWTELWDDLEPLLRRVMETGETFSAQDRPFYIERHGYGETAYFDVSYSAVTEVDGSMGGVLCIVSETTQRVLSTRRQALLLDLEDQLRAANDAEHAQQIAEHLLRRELEASITYFAEPGALLKTPFQGEGLASSGVSSPAQPSSHTGVAFTRAQREASDHVFEIDVPVLRNGAVIGQFSLTRSIPRHWTDQEVDFARSVVERAWNTAERCRAERALHELNSELEDRVAQALRQKEEALDRIHEMQKLETIGQLTGGVAHDFNNLLTPIMGALDVVAHLQGSDPRINRLTTAGLQAAERARTLIQRLLAFARRQHLQARPTDLGSLVFGIEDLLARTLGPQIRLEIECAPGLPLAMADPNQFELALLNLSVNARDAMPEGGKLEIALSDERVAGQTHLVDGQYLRIAVSDTGSGMDTQTLRQAIDPFFTTKGKEHGTGLGLSMVHGFAVQSGGHFSLISEPGRGTTALLWLPAFLGHADVEPRPGKVDTRVRRTQPATVLLVDDEELVRSVAAEMLSDAGYTVLQASSGYEAIAVLGKHPEIKALITDYAMPGLTGAELARQVAKLDPALPILMITGFAATDGKIAIKTPRLSKPFGQAELVRAVDSLLEHSQRNLDAV
ncbi:ATP-binding protein [Dyella jiangningensis]|uniref:ATP-binding protein n=1 Tax=Dyella jiangningensis TaxID=1379159 RepID=UPI00240F5AEF|nr:ATP-binding protein [Dyella jiangningensis]MDG2536379.1 ATP-binding protein [Dyella jiangningensis]